MISIINDTIKLVDELTEYLCALRENGYAISLCRLDPIFYAVFRPKAIIFVTTSSIAQS